MTTKNESSNLLTDVVSKTTELTTPSSSKNSESNSLLSKTSSIKDAVSSIPTSNSATESINKLVSGTKKSPSMVSRVTSLPGTIITSVVKNPMKTFSLFSVIIIVIVSILSYHYLQDYLSFIPNMFKNILQPTGDLVKQTTDSTATGSHGIIDILKNTVDTAINSINERNTKYEDKEYIEKNDPEINNRSDSHDVETQHNDTPDAESVHHQKKMDENNIAQDSKENARSINAKTPGDHVKDLVDKKHTRPMPSNTMDVSGKKGWCYVGSSKDGRTCMKVNEKDTCMSGDIFPTETLCINPNLR